MEMIARGFTSPIYRDCIICYNPADSRSIIFICDQNNQTLARVELKIPSCFRPVPVMRDKFSYEVGFYNSRGHIRYIHYFYDFRLRHVLDAIISEREDYLLDCVVL